MEKEPVVPNEQEETEAEALELVLFQVPECYAYLIPPRKSAASYRYFVLRVEENIDGRLRHAFIGLGFRERTEAYDFQAALHDHMKYLDKKKTAEEMEQKFQQTSSVDYSLKEGETIVLQLKNKTAEIVKSKVSENNSSPEKKANKKEPLICIKPPPPPPAPLSPSATVDKSSSNLPSNLNLEGTSKHEPFKSTEHESKETSSSGNQSTQDVPDDDFGDFQAAV